jgi:hypothetical protein
MSHWAEIDENNIVIRVLVGDNNEPDEGQAFMESLGGTWIKTSYNGKIRKNFAGVGMIYDDQLDAFIDIKCQHDEATLNPETYRWECLSDEHKAKAF